MAAIRARGLVKRFESTCALDGVELAVDEGEIRGLLGRNGAGKTTLLRVLLGLIRPDAGSVELLGRPLRGGGPDALAGVAGFVEEASFYPYLSGRANLVLLADLDGGVSDDTIDEALGVVGLQQRADDRVHGYSTGMRQRLGIAACLLRGPRLLLLDEPTAGLDPEGVREVAILLRDLSATGTAIVLSSHLIGEVEAICHSYTVIREGKVVWDGTAERLQAAAPAPCYKLETSDDSRALELARDWPELHVAPVPDGGLEVRLAREQLDPFVFALADARIAVRGLAMLDSPLESMFFELTAAGAAEPDPSRRGELQHASRANQ